MYRMVTGATGLIGKRLVAHWLRQKHSVTVVGRTLPHIQEVFGTSVRAITWDELTREQVEGMEVIVNLAGTNVGDKRWNEKRKQAILMSRVETTRKLANLLAELGHTSPPLFNASAVGIYGLQQQLPMQLPEALDEDTPVDKPKDFLSTVATRWEEAALPAIKSGVRVVFLRFGVVLAKEGGAFPKLSQAFKYYLGGKIGTGKQPFSWVAIDDVIRAIDFLIETPDVSGPFNIVAPQCVMQKTFAEILGHLLDRPAVFLMPGFVVSALFGGEMAQDLLLEGQHAYPKRLLELGFRFSYPDIETALNRILR